MTVSNDDLKQFSGRIQDSFTDIRQIVPGTILLVTDRRGSTANTLFDIVMVVDIEDSRKTVYGIDLKKLPRQVLKTIGTILNVDDKRKLPIAAALGVEYTKYTIAINVSHTVGKEIPIETFQQMVSKF